MQGCVLSLAFSSLEQGRSILGTVLRWASSSRSAEKINLGMRCPGSKTGRSQRRSKPKHPYYYLASTYVHQYWYAYSKLSGCTNDIVTTSRMSSGY
jgi:hypothetical protein